MRGFLTIIADLYRYDGRCRFAFTVIFVVIVFALLSFISPCDPGSSYYAAPDQPPCKAHLFGTNSRGQDLFWNMTFAVRNSLAFGVITALLSRIIAIFVGLTAGYKGGLIDRIMMVINDSFVVLPVLPLLILVNFIMQGQMSMFQLAMFMALFGWAWDARLIRSQVLSLKEREFTFTSVFSGAKTSSILLSEHLPFVTPIVFSTTINNLLWAIGMEVTLAVLGLSNIGIPTIGTTIYWANQHQALISGVWWWLAAPVAISVVLFVALYLLVVGLGEYLDPRTRLQRMKGALSDERA
ncbi:MAG: ABC transporter permease [Firmicutes bacterium]|nr:ABC transporter permease [Bacillota bacterium]